MDTEAAFIHSFIYSAQYIEYPRSALPAPYSGASMVKQEVWSCMLSLAGFRLIFSK